MDAFLNGFMTVFNAIMNAGVYVMLPIIITLLSLLFGLKLSKAFKAGVTIAIGFAGINLVVQLMKDQLAPRQRPWLIPLVFSSMFSTWDGALLRRPLGQAPSFLLSCSRLLPSIS